MGVRVRAWVRFQVRVIIKASFLGEFHSDKPKVIRVIYQESLEGLGNIAITSKIEHHECNTCYYCTLLTISKI